ncbi:AAA family ATPase [Bradyrhizobium sp. SSUT18]|uniref:AAA family ATPase n=1 Tax=Bradyrhizobium sp. SSUT18 TaxID=3040602 RepID=UPI00244834BC|nr:AAA family ATPase [Bradyrhizobium sp. SSUT18]MDH2405427.1 AAA family ATPase [Bradyrhizobium sp. SSUT18]
MARLTKADIEKTLLAGAILSYVDASGSPAALQLATPTQRRLFEFLLASTVRTPTALPAAFIAGLQKAFEATHDPAIAAATTGEDSLQSAGPWKLSLIEAEGFGGLNTWQGEIFTFDLACESFILEGPNGSGKSSLIGAVTWALTGQRPREQSEIAELEKRPIYGNGPKPMGQWPPLACYPPTTADAKRTPTVRVKLTFRDPGGQTATVERQLVGDRVSTRISPNFQIPPPFIETGLLMPSRIGRIRLNESGNRLKGAVEQLTGLDDLIAIGTLTAGLCHASREYRSYRTKELTALRGSFNRAVEAARSALARVNMPVAEFKPADTEDTSGPMVAFGKRLSELAAEQANVIKNDLHPNIQLGQAINPREIAAPVVTHRGSLDVRKIVGVLFEKGRPSAVLQTSRSEICDCGGQAALTHLAKTALGIVEVEGKSAEPLALDGQYLIVQDALTSQAAIGTQDGRPVIVEDSNGTHYFKRLRLQRDGSAVLESLHSGGEYSPIVLSSIGSEKNCLQKLWPVAGVLFELPGKAV